MIHPDFAVLTVSWELALRADGYADNTVKAYQKAVRSLADWLAEHHPAVGPIELERRHIRGWLVEVREGHSSNTARGWFAGVRHFCRWLQSEGETDHDATAGIRTPAPGDPETAVLSDEELRRLLATCTGTDFTARRDTAIIMLFLDGGLRLSELAGLQVADVDLRDRIVYVVGKASRRSGPRHRAVPLGVKAARALDRYLRERRRHHTRTRHGCGWEAEAGRLGTASSRGLLQVVADYTRPSAVQRPGRAGDGRASRPQYPGVDIGPKPVARRPRATVAMPLAATRPGRLTPAQRWTA
jgi:site-specific recombinase XerD